MAERTAPLLTEDSVACICLTTIIITFLVGGIALVASGHDAGYALVGAGSLCTYLFLF